MAFDNLAIKGDISLVYSKLPEIAKKAGWPVEVWSCPVSNSSGLYDSNRETELTHYISLTYGLHTDLESDVHVNFGNDITICNVCNITPTQKRELTEDEYNNILYQFYIDIVLPLLNDTSFTCEYERMVSVSRVPTGQMSIELSNGNNVYITLQAIKSYSFAVDRVIESYEFSDQAVMQMVKEFSKGNIVIDVSKLDLLLTDGSETPEKLLNTYSITRILVNNSIYSPRWNTAANGYNDTEFNRSQSSYADSTEFVIRFE